MHSIHMTPANALAANVLTVYTNDVADQCFEFRPSETAALDGFAQGKRRRSVGLMCGIYGLGLCCSTLDMIKSISGNQRRGLDGCSRRWIFQSTKLVILAKGKNGTGRGEGEMSVYSPFAYCTLPLLFITVRSHLSAGYYENSS